MKPNDQAYQAALRATSDSCSAYQIQNALDAAYAAQFQSEDYAGLVKELREECRDWLTADCVTKAADALEAVLAERDALLARLAPVEDGALVEIVAREIAFAQGDVESPNSEFMDENWHCWEPEARAAIAAIRPHIEAAERERCAKIADKYEGEWHSDPAEDACARAIATAIRSGK